MAKRLRRLGRSKTKTERCLDLVSQALGLLEQTMKERGSLSKGHPKRKADKKNESDQLVEKNGLVGKSDAKNNLVQKSGAGNKETRSISAREFILALVCAIIVIPIGKILEFEGHSLWEGAKFVALLVAEILRIAS